jgi:CRISPR-associated endoribonuclease Cas6
MLSKLALARYRFVLEATTPLRLNAFAGATLRGGFGHVFKRAVCTWPPGECRRCLLKDTCSYRYIFETAPPAGAQKLRNLDQVPRPFVIEPPRANGRLHRPGERFEFRLVLVGRAIDYLPYFLLTFGELGRVGLGPDRGRFVVDEVLAEGPDGAQPLYTEAKGMLHDRARRFTVAELVGPRFGYDMVRRWTVLFLTPTRIRQGGAVRTDLSFQDLSRALLRRLSSLCYFHCGSQLAVDFRSLIEQAAAVSTIRSDLRWHDQGRFSGRQHRTIEMGGVVGEITFEAADPQVGTCFWPLLVAGEWVHVGKGCVMGLGKYRLEVEHAG